MVQVNLDCAYIERIAHTLNLVEECDVVRNGALRMATPFLYPNGDRIDVFLEANASSLFRHLSLTDYGQTALYLRSAQVKMEATARKREIFDEILSSLSVKSINGDLYVEIEKTEPDDLTDAIFRLSQACIRISEFASHQRLRSANPFRDDVEDFFEASKLPFVPDVKVLGRYKNEVKIDFEIVMPKVRSYVCVLSTMSESTAHQSAIEAFRKWYDIKPPDILFGEKLITVYNSKSKTKIREADQKRLRDYSQLIAYPAEQELLASVLRGDAA
jgi:hypothetical protein